MWVESLSIDIDGGESVSVGGKQRLVTGHLSVYIGIMVWKWGRTPQGHIGTRNAFENLTQTFRKNRGGSFAHVASSQFHISCNVGYELQV